MHSRHSHSGPANSDHRYYGTIVTRLSIAGLPMIGNGEFLLRENSLTHVPQNSRAFLRTCAAWDIIGIGSDDKLVENKTILAHPYVEGVDAWKVNLDRSNRAVYSRFGPGLLCAKTGDSINCSHGCTVEAGMIGIIPS